MINNQNPYGNSLLPQTVNPPASHASAAKLYQRVQASDPERMGGTIVHYNSFDDFLTTCEIEANDPNVVGTADVLDIINPLQHLPLISNIYRSITDDQIKPGARIMGGAVFGGGMGLASSSVNAVVEEETGKDLPTNLISALSGEDSFTKQHRGLALDGNSNDPQEQLNILLGDDAARLAAQSPQHITSAYRRAAAAAPPTERYERVVMADPERMAGSFARYA